MGFSYFFTATKRKNLLFIDGGIKMPFYKDPNIHLYSYQKHRNASYLSIDCTQFDERFLKAERPTEPAKVENKADSAQQEVPPLESKYAPEPESKQTSLTIMAKGKEKLPVFPQRIHTFVVMGNNDVFYGEWMDVVNNFLQLKLAADTRTHHYKGQTVYLNIDNISSLI
jgi:hypothetical protein